MLSVIEEHGLVLLRGSEILVGFVAIVEKVDPYLVEQQSRSKYDPRDSAYSAFSHESKITNY